MAEPDRSSNDGTQENENEADSGTHHDGGNDHSNEEGGEQDNEADQSGSQSSPVGVPDGVLNTNYDSSDGAIPVHRCDRCENYEALTHVALLSHLAQCPGNEVESPTPGEVHRGHDRKIFECDVCNMKFSNGANMRRHKMRHTGVKPYECRICQKRFFRKDHLAEHFTTHTKTLPYHCPICNRGFQRQIAMRAHFQNEHVGQHDMIKSCPLCSYRAGSMKSLRVHFFNRHGIDLDNPGPSQPSASSAIPASGQCSPLEPSCNINVGASYSDSGDSVGARSVDNATPPMHFLTPHVEISMADAPATGFSPAQSEHPLASASQSGSELSSQHLNGECPGSPHSADSNSNAPSSSLNNSLKRPEPEGTSITPSISLIPIKQEPGSEDPVRANGPVNLTTSRSGAELASGATNVQFPTASSSSLTSLIKVSPLKSLLRDDLKRKIGNRMAPQIAHGHPSAGSGHPESSFPIQPIAATTTNGAITSTGPEQPSDSTEWRSPHKRIPSLQCIFCGIAFPDQTLYFLHKGCHSDSNPWKCNICGEQCSNVYEFNSHLLSKTHQ